MSKKTPEELGQEFDEPRCDNCRWGMELEERYDHRHCYNPDSMDGGGDVEASHSCPFFEPDIL